MCSMRMLVEECIVSVMLLSIKFPSMSCNSGKFSLLISTVEIH